MPDTNILHNPVPSESVARILSDGSKGIVETKCGKVFTYDSGRRRNHRFVEEKSGFHPGFWLQPALSAQLGNPVCQMPSGEYPFTELQTQLEFTARVCGALKYFQWSLDPELDVDFRQHAARKATHMLKEDAVRVRAEPVLINNPMPKEFDIAHGPTEGQAGEILQKMIAKWRPSQPEVSLWTAVEFDRIHLYTADAFAAWLRTGLELWNKPAKRHQAFSPLSDRFSGNESLTMQLVEMARHMDVALRTEFVEGVRRYRDDSMERGRSDDADFADNLFCMLDIAV